MVHLTCSACAACRVAVPSARESLALLCDKRLRGWLAVADPRATCASDAMRLHGVVTRATADNALSRILCVKQLCAWATAFGEAVRFYHEHW